MSDKPEDDSKTGYGKPPVHSQFKKGQSGNPGGKRRSRATSALERILAQPAKLRDGSMGTRLDLIMEGFVSRAEDNGKYLALFFKELRHRENSVGGMLSEEVFADDALISDEAEANASDGGETGSAEGEASEEQPHTEEETT
jgi:hypothetical protein